MSKAFKKEDIESVFKTHFGEQSLIVMEMDKENGTYYTETAILKIHDRFLSIEDIENWIYSVPRFRDVFIYEKIEQPVRVRLKKIVPPIEIIDDQSRTEKQILDWLESQQFNFDIQKAPLFKVFVFKGEDCQILACCYHHLLFDAISIQQVFATLLSGIPISTNEWLPKLEKKESIQKNEFVGFQLQNFVPPPSNESNGFLYESLILENVTYQDFMSNWIEFLFQASGDEQVSIGEVFSMRNSEMAALNALGYFVQTWPLIFNRNDENIANELTKQRSQILSQSDQAVQNYFTHNLFDHCWVVEPDLKSDFKTIFRSKPHYLLSIVIQPNEEVTSLTFVWNLSKISEEAAKEIVNSFQEFISPKKNTDSIEKYDYEINSVIGTWYKNLNNVRNRVAVQDSSGKTYSYHEIEELSNKLACSLEISVQEPIGIRTSNSVSLVIAILAVLKKRGIYVPLDPEISEERLNYILEDAKIQTIISDLNEIPDKKTIHPIHEITISESFENNHAELDEICYLIYTSGTTGQPKGCCVTNANLSNLFQGSQEKFNFTPDDRWILAHNYGFDFSTWEIWGALLNGCSLIIPERMDVKDSFKFYDILLKEKITILNQTPKSFDNLMLVGESSSKLRDLKYVIFGGDKLNTQKIANWQRDNRYVTLVNMYGITETTVHVSYKEIKLEKYSNIGTALPGYSVQLQNKRYEEVPNGFIGELIVQGAGVCKGYYGKEELTREKFSFGILPSYKSGDLGWKMQDDFFYLGRNDRQVKIRGHRIELGEIEFLLQNKFGNLFRVIFIGENKLVAFHICEFDIDRSECKGILPDYANPSQFIRLDSIPLNVNGKTDEKALVETYKNRQNGILIEDQVNTDLIPYLSKLLGEQIDINKSFIENGGDSISAIRLVNSLRKDGFNLSVQDLFASPNLKDVKIQISKTENKLSDWKSNTEIGAYNKANNSDIIGLFPLTDAQSGILFDSMAGDESVYFIQLTYQVDNQITTSDLIKSYYEVLNVLPALQLQLIQWNEQYMWALPKMPEIEINVIRENQSIDETLKDDFQKPFDFSKNLMRLTIVERLNGDKLLIWTHHHLLMDGWSLGVFSKLLFESLSGEKPQRKEAYLNFLFNQSNNNLDSTIGYWKNRLKNNSSEPLIPFLSIGEKTKDYGEHTSKIERINLWNGLSSHDLTQNQFVFAAWLAFVGVAFQKNSLSFGRVNSLRDGMLDDEVGMLIQTLPFSCEINLDETFKNVALELKSHLIEDNKHREIPLAQLDGINLNLDSLFVFENYPIDQSITEELPIKIGDFKEKTGAKWTFICYPEENGIKLRVLYQKDFYHQEYVEHIIGRFAEFITRLDWNDSLSSHSKYISKQSANSGEIVQIHSSENLFNHFLRKSTSSFIQEGNALSHEFITKEVEELTRNLIELGLTKNESVGIDVKSTKHFIVSVLSIWKIGAVPCSVDFRYPGQRKSFIWQNASCRFVLTENDGKLEIEQNEHQSKSQPENASFILHTSGSTGTPKGVIQTKDCLVHLAHWTANHLGLSSTDRILALSSFGFDASYHELILWIELGATLVEMPYENRQDIHEIRKVINEQKVTLAWIPARMLNTILDTDPTYFDECISLKQIVTTGEALIVGDSLKKWVERKDIRLFNFYGPTETHVVTARVVDKSNISKIPDIGYPLTNAGIGLYDQNGNEIPKGLVGEIWISGPYLAYGYLNDISLTNEKFVFKDGIRWYKSGDSGWTGNDGRIEYLGRLDNQIKIRGFRVEPFEVESILHSVAGIEQAAIAIDRLDEIKLIAFWTGKKMSDSEFRKACSELMPEFMIPEIQVHLNELPRNINGKIDRKLLLEIYNHSKSEFIEKLPITNASKCWEAVLGHTHFKANSHFQSVGGNSLKIMRMQAWLEKNYQISVSVQELILNQKIDDLNNLISEKQNQVIFEIPKELPLNKLQQAIVLSEKGNYSNNESPFLLSFSCAIPFEIENEKFRKALEDLFVVYPHLGYVLHNNEDLSKMKWQSSENYMDFVQKPLNDLSLFNSEPLLRIFLENEKLYVHWHHVLLDAVGISMVMQELFNLLTSREEAKARNYSLFLNHSGVENLAKTITAIGKPRIYTRTIDTSEKRELKLLAEQHEISILDLFLLLSHSIFDSSDFIGFTDNNQQIGIPGMYTFLNTSALSNMGETKQMLLKGLTQDKHVAMVTNFMHSPDLPDLNFQIENSKIKTCKYPYELQIEVTNDNIYMQLIAEEKNAFAEEKSNKLFENLDKLLKLKTFKDILETEKKTSNIHFDDFDF
jgi:amino acid adenylation domain-containing protein